MRVLHLYAGNVFGGVERTLLHLWHARDAAPEMRPAFGLCFDGPLARELRASGAPVEVFGPARAAKPWTLWRVRRRLRAFLDRERFDVAVAHSFWPHAVFAPAVRAARPARVPLVMWVHDVPRAGDRWMRRAQRSRPDLLLANSEFTASHVARYFTGEPMEIQYPPVEFCDEPDRARVRAEVRNAIGTPQDALVVLMASRFQPGKGHRVLLRAIARLPATMSFECWLAGDAQRPAERVYRQTLEEHARLTGGAQRIRWLGQRNDVPRLLAAADVLCQPNTVPEGFGLIFIEAMASGVPVVTSDLGAAREIVGDSSDLLVPPDDPDAVAEAINRIASGRFMFDADRARRRAVELCDPRHALPRLAQVLERANSQSPSRREGRGLG